MANNRHICGKRQETTAIRISLQEAIENIRYVFKSSQKLPITKVWMLAFKIFFAHADGSKLVHIQLDIFQLEAFKIKKSVSL